jgi:hypothetical protein
MPLQNRVLPDGSIVAAPQRGTMMGNRGGAFHRDDQTLAARRWHSRQWICCVLSFKGRRRPVMQPRRYTELFFLDEATALAAGHRPCFECRRPAALEFAERWNAARALPGRAKAYEMDQVLHGERLDHGGAKRTYRAAVAELPEHVIVRLGGNLYRTTPAGLQLWSLDGYSGYIECAADAVVDVLTPPSIVTILRAGYVPALHNSAATAADSASPTSYPFEV